MVELRGYKINTLQIENKAQNGTELKLQNQVKYNVNYMDDDKRCIGMLEFALRDANMNPFELKLEAVAEFTYGAEDDKADIHTDSFDQLFPFIRQIVNTVTSFTGMPGLFIPIIKLNRDTVQVNEPKESSPLN